MVTPLEAKILDSTLVHTSPALLITVSAVPLALAANIPEAVFHIWSFTAPGTTLFAKEELRALSNTFPMGVFSIVVPSSFAAPCAPLLYPDQKTDLLPPLSPNCGAAVSATCVNARPPAVASSLLETSSPFQAFALTVERRSPPGVRTEYAAPSMDQPKHAALLSLSAASSPFLSSNFPTDSLVCDNYHSDP
jgi:hypothetical protein